MFILSDLEIVTAFAVGHLFCGERCFENCRDVACLVSFFVGWGVGCCCCRDAACHVSTVPPPLSHRVPQVLKVPKFICCHQKKHYLCIKIEKTLLENRMMETAIKTPTRLTGRAKPIKSKSTCELKQYNTTVSPKGYTIEESYNRGLDLLSELYGTDFRKL